MSQNKIKLFLVDDDALFLKSLEISFLAKADFEIFTFSTGESCIENLTSKPDLIILDFHLDGIDRSAMNGLDTLINIKNIDENIPIIMLSSQDSIDVAISCMHNKADDYVVKSETAFVRLQKIITTLFENKKLQNQLFWYMERM